VATSTAIPALHGTVAVQVTVSDGVLTVLLNGTRVLSIFVTLSPNVLVGFTGSTGATPAAQDISGVSISAGGPVTTVGDPTAGGWTINGSSTLTGGSLQLTTAGTKSEAGTAFWPTALPSSNLTATFTTTIGGGGATGADGMALVLADASTPADSVGSTGSGLGFSGIPGVAVALDTYQNAVNPSDNFVGVTNGPISSGTPGELDWLTTDTAVTPLRTTHVFRVTLVNGTLTVAMDGIALFSTPVTVGPDVLVGFSGGNGLNTDTHAVSHVTINAAPDSPVAIGDPSGSGWDLNGSTQVVGGVTDLTQAGTDDQAGTAFWPTAVASEGLTASFTATIGGGGSQGADGMTLVLADPNTSPTAVGYYGGGLGFSGIKGIAVCIDTYQNGSNPSSNFVGITNGPISTSVPDHLNWLASQTVAQDLRGTNAFTVTLDDGILTVDMDGSEILSAAVNVGPEALVGFSGGDGSVTDTHSVSETSILSA
jgi:hypothetical protein